MKNLLVLVYIILSIGGFAQSNNRLGGKKIYVCPPCGNPTCDHMIFDEPGTCPHCAMDLEDLNIKDSLQKITVALYLQDNVEILDFAGPLEVFQIAGFHVFTVSKKKENLVTQRTLSFTPDYAINDAPPSNVMAFFGGGHVRPMEDANVIEWIQSRKPKTEYVFTVCTGAFIAGKAGLLDNLTATTYHSQIPSLQNALPKTKVVSNVRFVDNGKVITTAGISAGIDGALHFVAKVRSVEYAQAVAKAMEYEYWKPNNGLIVK